MKRKRQTTDGGMKKLRRLAGPFKALTKRDAEGVESFAATGTDIETRPKRNRKTAKEREKTLRRSPRYVTKVNKDDAGCSTRPVIVKARIKKRSKTKRRATEEGCKASRRSPRSVVKLNIDGAKRKMESVKKEPEVKKRRKSKHRAKNVAIRSKRSAKSVAKLGTENARRLKDPEKAESVVKKCRKSKQRTAGDFKKAKRSQQSVTVLFKDGAGRYKGSVETNTETETSGTAFTGIKTERMADITLMDEESFMRCRITGSTILQGNRLVLADNIKCQLWVVNTDDNVVMSTSKLEGYPWAVCKAIDNSVATTLCYNRKIIFLRLEQDGKLSHERELCFERECVSIAITEDRMFVSFREPAMLKIMTLEGVISQIIEADSKGGRLFEAPHYVTLGPQNRGVYVSDVELHKVVRMSLEGSVEATYEDSELQRIEQIAVDNRRGLLYVSGYSSNNVYLVTPYCWKARLLLDQSDGIKDVLSTCYCEETGRLYIGMNNCNEIKVFQLV